ncbi:hypothetical protein PITCH_A290002 [uncultured Desulfobacterium sp.]|uniref:Uncharacterized protein n=1 Tax=uncultured Desulfobacterium sp. TaxID=201089 RepID=A0A445MYR3_9BACT|nr:hypothetical protein PITCH_A290002 [uncultured Desulfobacterium sp.]
MTTQQSWRTDYEEIHHPYISACFFGAPDFFTLSGGLRPGDGKIQLLSPDL